MEKLKRNVKHLVQICLAGVVLSGCVSTLPPEGRAVDAEVYEQKKLGIAYGFFVNGYPTRALDQLQEILSVNSKSAKAYGMLGVIQKSQGELQLAKEYFRKSLSLDSSASDVRNNYGVLLFELGEYDAAKGEFQKVTEDVYYGQRSRAFENLGIVDLKMGDEDGAMKHFERALRLDQNLPIANLELSEMLFDIKNYVDAERYYQTYLNLTKNSRPTARALWLGIQLARIFDQPDQLSEYADQLARFYPESAEYREYRESLASLK